MRAFVLGTLAATMLAVPALAEDGGAIAMGEEVDVSFEASRVRLVAEGYREVEMVDGDALWLSAFDRDGSEVLLTISPQSGEIDGWSYIRPVTE